MRDELSRAGDLVDGLNVAIRENPLAAGLIGAGVAWMLMGGTRGLSFAAGAAKTAATKVGSAAATAGTAVSRGIGEAGSQVGAVARQAKDSASAVTGGTTSLVPDLPAPDINRAYDSVADVGSALQDRLNSAAASGRAHGATLHDKLGQSLDRQPLLLGALGLAIGAGIAATFAATKRESEWIGEKGAAVRQTLQHATEEAKERARQVVSDLKEETHAQGLAPGAVKDAMADVADKAKIVAGSARDTVAQRLSNPSKL